MCDPFVIADVLVQWKRINMAIHGHFVIVQIYMYLASHDRAYCPRYRNVAANLL